MVLKYIIVEDMLLTKIEIIFFFLTLKWVEELNVTAVRKENKKHKLRTNLDILFQKYIFKTFI